MKKITFVTLTLYASGLLWAIPASTAGLIGGKCGPEGKRQYIAGKDGGFHVYICQANQWRYLYFEAGQIGNKAD